MNRHLNRLLLAALLALLQLSVKAEEARQLDGMSVVGAQELPKALYIVPWKQAEPGDPAPAFAQGLLGEGLAPLDREVFRRELHYHEALRQQRDRIQ
ncbi:MAG: hypothetical protein JJU06_10015 [Ectothiorhodospiraceae bacterium]|nr:hypothetical protein [Ectothiorhodospiraceae bacterium]MCH8504985.1 hypothetical protein [Ectothiorhodospiraceae bacterium]